jgi:ATP-dependent RNA helicase DOB1
MEQKMFASPLHKDPRLPELYDLYSRKREAQDRVRALKKRIQATHDVLQMEELKSRKRVLRRLGFTTADDIVDVKGRVACEISTGDELLLTELVFNGVFNPLAPEHCAGLLSCFVFTEKVRLPHNIAGPMR